MTRIISLFQQKSHYLEKFCQANDEAIEQFADGNFDSLDSFYQMREDIIQVLNYIDAQVKLAQEDIKDAEFKDKDKLRAALAQKDSYVHRIMQQDLKILSFIDRAKSEIIRELQDLKKSKTAIGRYKSGMTPRRLDEEV